MPSQFLVEKSPLFEPPDLNAKQVDKLKPTGFSTNIKFYVLPDCTEKLRLNFGVYLMFCGSSLTTDIQQWKSWLVTWTCLLIPIFTNELSRKGYMPIEIQPDNFEEFSRKLDVLNPALKSNETELGRKSMAEVREFYQNLL